MVTKIEWTNETWNPVTGCTKISPGCKHCYAERMAKRLQGMGQPNYANGFQLTLQPHMLERPLRWKKPRMIFVNSMSDLFHEDVPIEFIDKVFDIIGRCPRHTFLILTKRPKYALEYWSGGNYSVAERRRQVASDKTFRETWPNVWMGVSVENQAAVDERLPILLKIPSAVRFLSCEPLLESIRPRLATSITRKMSIWPLQQRLIDWVIAGCESGPGARPAEIDWFRSLRDQCIEAEVPFFLKQMMVAGKIQNMPRLDGIIWDKYPQSVDPFF